MAPLYPVFGEKPLIGATSSFRSALCTLRMKSGDGDGEHVCGPRGGEDLGVTVRLTKLAMLELSQISVCPFHVSK